MAFSDYHFLGIDGSGPMNDKTYQAEFSDSFVCRLSRQFSNAFYHRGPPTLDVLESRNCTVYSRLQAAKALAFQRATLGARSGIVCAGYSRGGAAMLDLCEDLGKQDISISMLILFDPVDMSEFIRAWAVPANVERCLLFRRSSYARSRQMFNVGTAGIIHKGPTYRIHQHTFHCTHGAAGGTKYNEKDVNEEGCIGEPKTLQYTRVGLDDDENARRQIWSITQSFLAQLRIVDTPIEVESTDRLQHGRV